MTVTFINPYVHNPEITFVGGRSDSVASTTISLTGLTGGIDSEPQAGDVVVLAIAQGVDAGTVNNLSVSGYSNSVSQAVTSQSGDNLYVTLVYKVLTASDTEATVTNLDPAQGSVVVHVWRYVDNTTPVDVTRTLNTTSNALPANPTIVPNTFGAQILSIVAIGSDITNRTWTNSSLDFVFSAADDSTTGNESHVGIGARPTKWAGSAYTPPAWTTDDSDPTYASASITFALRPMYPD